jgi:amino acid transporter
VLSVANVAPTFSIGVGLGIIAAAAPGSLTAALLIASLPIWAIAVAYARLNRDEPTAGTGYTWVGRSLNPWLGFLNGWVVLVSVVLFLAYGSQVAGLTTISLLHAAHVDSLFGVALTGSATQSTVIGLIWLAAVTTLVVLGIDLAARFQRILIVFELGVLAVFLTLAIVRGHGAPFDAHWLNPFGFASGQAFATAVVVAVYFYWGFEVVFSVSPESSNPRRSGRAGYCALVAILMVFLYASIGMQRALSTDELSGGTALTRLGTSLAGQPWASLTLLALLTSTVAVLQTPLISTSRYALAMSRDGVIGSIWSRLHARFGTPWAGTVLFAGLASLVAILSVRLGTITTIIGGAVTAIGLIVSYYYGMVALACAARFARRRRTTADLWLGVVLPLLGAAALFALGGYLAWTNWTSTSTLAFSADNGRFLDLVPAAILLSGLPVAAWARFKRRSPYFAVRG